MVTTTDTDALKERIARALRQATDDGADRTEDYAAAVLPIVAEEVHKAKAEALREAAGSIDLDKIADEWSQGPGNRDDMHWAAGNAASSVVLALHDRATEYETGDSDDRR